MTVHITDFVIDDKGNGHAVFSDGDIIEFEGLTDICFIKLEDGVNHHREQLILRKITELKKVS